MDDAFFNKLSDEQKNIFLRTDEVNLQETGINIKDIKDILESRSYLNKCKSFNMLNEKNENIIIFNLKKKSKSNLFFTYPFSSYYGAGIKIVGKFDNEVISECVYLGTNQFDYLSNNAFIKILILINSSYKLSFIAKIDDISSKIKEIDNHFKYRIFSDEGVEANRIIETKKDHPDYILIKNWMHNNVVALENLNMLYENLKSLDRNIDLNIKFLNVLFDELKKSSDFNEFYYWWKDLVITNFKSLWFSWLELIELKKENDLKFLLSFEEFYRSMINCILLDPEFSNIGRVMCFIDTSNYKIKFHDISFDIAKDDELECFWKQSIHMHPVFDLDKLIDSTDIPANHKNDLVEFVNFSTNEPVQSIYKKIEDLLLEAVALKKWTIPFGAKFLIEIGPFNSVNIFEINKDIYFVFRTPENRFQIESICPHQKTYSNFETYSEINDQNNLIKEFKIENKSDEEKLKKLLKNNKTKYDIQRAIWILWCCTVIRDFQVVEYREKVFSHKSDKYSSNLKRYSENENDERPRIVYIPRVKYIYIDKNTNSNNNLNNSNKGKINHFVSAHLRKVGQASKYQIELARRYGFFDIPEGYTFISPHYKGDIKKETIYRSRSVLNQFFKTDPILNDNKIPEWFKFERDVYNFFKKEGFEVDHVGPTDNNGVDVMASKNGEEYLIQCKCWKNNVGPEIVRELIGSLDLHKANKGIIISTSNFSNQAIKSAYKSSKEIELINGGEFYQLLNS